jgi:hypothetical protein
VTINRRLDFAHPLEALLWKECKFSAYQMLLLYLFPNPVFRYRSLINFVHTAVVYSFGIMMWELHRGSTAYTQYVKVARADAVAAGISPPAHVPTDGRIMTMQKKLFTYELSNLAGATAAQDDCSSAMIDFAQLGAACTHENTSQRHSSLDIVPPVMGLRHMNAE